MLEGMNPFMVLLIPLFWASSDVCNGFESQGGFFACFLACMILRFNSCVRPAQTMGHLTWPILLNRMAHACEKITFHCTTYVVGNQDMDLICWTTIMKLCHELNPPKWAKCPESPTRTPRISASAYGHVCKYVRSGLMDHGQGSISQR